MHRLLVRTIPRAGDSPVATHHCAAHRRDALRLCAWFSVEAVRSSRVSRVSLPQLPSFITKEVPYAHYDRWVAALQQSPIFSLRTYHPQPREPGFAVPIQDPKSIQELLALLRRYSEVCEVTKGREALEQVVEQTHRVVSNLPDKELAGVVSALLAAGKIEEVVQLMDAYRKSGARYVRPWDVLLEYYFQEKQSAAVESIAQYLQDNQVSSRAAHYIMSALAHAGDVPALQLFLRKYETLIPVESVEFCEEIIRSLLDAPRIPDNWPMSDQMWNLVQRGAVDDVISELQKPGTEKIGAECYSALMRRLAARVPLDAWRKLQAFVAERGAQIDDAEFYNGRIEFGEADLVQEVLREMDAQGVARNIGTFDALIYAAGVRGDLQECQRLLGEISEKSLAPSSQTFCNVLDYWRSKGNFESAMLFWDEIRRLQIALPPFAHERLKEVMYQYAAKMDEEELQTLYKHVDANDIPEQLTGLRSVPDLSYDTRHKLVREFQFSSHMPTPQTTAWEKDKTPMISKSGSSSDGFAEFTYQDGANLAELTNFFEGNLQNIPSREATPNLTFIPLQITTSEVEKYNEMRRILRERKKDTTEFLNKALVTFQDYTKRWFNQVLLDLAEDDVEFTSDGYSALVHRAWKMGDREECERLLAQISLKMVPETDEVAQIRAELFPARPDQSVVNNAALRDLLSELQKPQTDVDLQRLQEMAKQIAANLAHGITATQAPTQVPHELAPSASHEVPAHAPSADAAHSAFPASGEDPASAALSSPLATPESPASPADLVARAGSTPHVESAQIVSSIREDIDKSRADRRAQSKLMGASIAELMERMKQTNTMEDRAKVFEFADQQFSEAKVYMFEKMITSCAQEGDLEGSIRIFADMKNHGVQPTAHIYQVAIGALLEMENFGDALTHFLAACQAGIKVTKLKRSALNALARTAAARGEIEALHSLVEEMYESEITPDPDVLYNLSINLAEQGDITGSVRILEEIKTAHSVDPDSLFNALVKTLTTSGNADHRYKLIEEMASRGVALNNSTLNTLLYELVREGDIDASLLLVREIRSSGGEIDVLSEYAFSQYFDAEVGTTNKREAVQKLAALVDEVGRGKDWVGPLVYGRLIIKMIYFGLETKALKFLAGAKHLFDAHWQNAIVQVLAMRKSLRAQTVTYVQEMRAAGVALDTATYAALIRAHMRAGEMQKAISFVEEAHRNKHEFEEGLYDELISACVAKGDHDSSFKIAEEMGGTMVGLTPTALMVFLRQSLTVKDTQGCADVLLRLRSQRNLTPHDITFVVTRHHNFPQLIEALTQTDANQDSLTQAERDELIAQLTRAHEGKPSEQRANAQTRQPEMPKPKQKIELPKEVEEFGPPTALKTFDELLKMRGDRARFTQRYDALRAAQPTQKILAQLAEMDLSSAKSLHYRVLSCAILARDKDASIALLRHAAVNYGSIYIDAMSFLSRWLVQDFDLEMYDLACQVAAKNGTMWNLLLIAMAERDDVTRVAALVQKTREWKIVLYPRTYEQIMALFSRMDNLDACLALYKHFTTTFPKNTDTKPRIATVLLKTMARLKQFEKWTEILQDLKSTKILIDATQLIPLLQADQIRLLQVSEQGSVSPKMWQAPALKRPRKVISSKLPPKKDEKPIPVNPSTLQDIPETTAPKSTPKPKISKPNITTKNANKNKNTNKNTTENQKQFQTTKVKM
eukprot:Phypoly_transcript_00337.p1 GENE.Phypoly_transcript_00337~~Phypoly_transcript_00337.p1  ORF type:complete len:1695 (-),score=400.60 Phypoly_transcript_00337:1-5085(-)